MKCHPRKFKYGSLLISGVLLKQEASVGNKKAATSKFLHSQSKDLTIASADYYRTAVIHPWSADHSLRMK